MFDNLKLIGLHKGSYNQDKNKNKKTKINLGIPLNLIINEINNIKINPFKILKINEKDENVNIAKFAIVWDYVYERFKKLKSLEPLNKIINLSYYIILNKDNNEKFYRNGNIFMIKKKV